MQGLQGTKSEFEGSTSGWNTIRVDTFLKINMGQSPPSESYNDKKQGLPFFQGVTDFGNIHPEPRIWCSDPKRIADVNQILLSVRAPVGEVNLANIKCCIGRGIAALIPKDADTGYCFYLLSQFKSQFLRYSQGTTFGAINRDEIARVRVPYTHDILEQQKIAYILSRLDELIQKTNQIVEQTQKLRKGLIQRLLTKGTGHSEFKKVKWYYDKEREIPKAWKLVLLDEVAQRGTGHTPDAKKPEYYDGGIKWVSLADSNKLDNLYIAETAKEISERGLENSSAVKHPAGTVIMSRDAGVGKSAILKIEMAVSQHFVTWRCKEWLNNHFLYYVLQYWKPLFESIAIGTTIKTIGLPFFKKLPMILPPLDEQERIVSILVNSDMQVCKEQGYNSDLQDLKKGLMQKLLTGRIRVKV